MQMVLVGLAEVGCSREWATGERQAPSSLKYPGSWQEHVGITLLPWQCALPFTGNSIPLPGPAVQGGRPAELVGPVGTPLPLEWVFPCPGEFVP